MESTYIPKNSSFLTKHDWQALTFVLFACIVLRMVFFYGFLGTDDSVITSMAIKIVEQGMYIPESHYDSRLGLILPVAFVFKIFGIGAMQAAIFPLVCALGLSLVTYLTCRKSGMVVYFATVAALIPAVIPIAVQFGTSIYPEVPFAFFIAISVLVVVNRTCNAAPAKLNYKDYLILFLSLFFAYLVKIEAVFIIGAYFLFFLYLKHFKQALLIITFPVLFMLAEDLLFYSQAMDFNFFNRLDILTSGQSATKMGTSHSAKQLWVYPKSMLITFYNFGLHFHFLLAAFLWFVVVRPRKDRHIIVLLSLCSIGFMLWLQFGGTPKALIRFLTTGVLNTKTHLDRYLVMILPFSPILIALFLANTNWLKSKFSRHFTVATLLGSMLVLLPLNDISQEYAIGYKSAAAILEKKQPSEIYCDRATCSYFNKLKQLGELEGFTFTNIVSHVSRTGKSSKNSEFEQYGGYVLINKNRYLYYHRRYLISYPTLASLENLGEKTTIVSNPASWLSYVYLRSINALLSIAPPDNFITQKVQTTIDEALDPDDIMLIKISAENAKMLEYL
jgi:hypothetical protein